MTAPSPRPRSQRHLLDLDAPRPPRDPRAEERLQRVQQWVLSTLAVTTILHMAAGGVVASMFATRPSAQIGLNVCAAAFGVMAVAAGLAIHRRSLLTPWLLLGLTPGIIGIWLVRG